MTGLYVDSSAILKRIFIEPESDRLRQILRERHQSADLVATSDLAWVEVYRAVLRSGTDAGTFIGQAFSGIARQALTPEVMVRARTIGAPTLRSLDAIHLASAISLGATEILTYDHRLADSANSLGVTAID